MCHRPPLAVRRQHFQHLDKLIIKVSSALARSVPLVDLRRKRAPDVRYRGHHLCLHLHQRRLRLRPANTHSLHDPHPMVQEKPPERPLPQVIVVDTVCPVPRQIMLYCHCSIRQLWGPVRQQSNHVVLTLPLSYTVLLVEGPRQTQHLLGQSRHRQCLHHRMNGSHTPLSLIHHHSMLTLCMHMPVGLLRLATQPAPRA